MYYQLIYHIPNAVEHDDSDEAQEYATKRFHEKLAYNLTAGGLRKFAQDINFAVVRDDFRGFEIIVAYPDFLTPDKPVLYSILHEQEGIFDINFSEKPVCFDHIHLHQISAFEFLMRLSQSQCSLVNVLKLINAPHREYYGSMERKTKEALEKLNKQNESNNSEKENHVL